MKPLEDYKVDVSISTIAKVHNEWLNDMGWNKTTPLEQLALIASEIGEAVNECRGEKPTDKLGSELADIILRTMGLAEQSGIDIQTEILNKMAINRAKGNYKNRLK
jgi:NTP pyrophosphatase (non-canonical NTP hydrolase)